jgi:transposase
MQESNLARFLSLPEVKILNSNPGPKGIWVSAEKVRASFEICPRCGAKSSSVYDHRTISVRDEPIRRAAVTLKLLKRRYYCHACRKPFTEPVPGIWPKRKTTQRFREALRVACDRYSNLSQVRKDFRVSSSFLYKVYYEQLALKNKQINPIWPKALGIDEHFVRRQFGYPQFMTIFTDLKRHSVRECVLGKTKLSLKEQTSHMYGRHQVEWITIDMSDTYRGFALEHFPKAQIIADKFHVLRLFSNILNRNRIDITGDVRKNPVRKLLLRNRNRLKYFQKNALDLGLHT